MTTLQQASRSHLPIEYRPNGVTPLLPTPVNFLRQNMWQVIDDRDPFVQNSASLAPVAQLDRVPGYEPGGREFESLRAHQYENNEANGLPHWLFCCLTHAIGREAFATEMHQKNAASEKPLPTKKPRKRGFFAYWRRVRDSNPR